MKKYVFGLTLFFSSLNLFAWGPIGHRVVGQIAENHLTKTAKQNLTKILKDETLASISTWPDFIRSDKAWDKAVTWHYVTIPDDKTYAQIEKEPKGDIIESLERFKLLLQNTKASQEDKLIALKFLVHLMGDIHQPLHVGKPGDKGGNDIKVKWFKEETNLHHIWDESLINLQAYSFSEYARLIDHFKPEEIKSLQAASLDDIVSENKKLREQVYTIENGSLGYDYNFKNIATVNERLKFAGIRLAGILNQIFSK